MAKMTAQDGGSSDDGWIDQAGDWLSDAADSATDSGSSLGWSQLKGALPNNDAVELLKGPRAFIRGVFFSTIFRGIASVVSTIFASVTLLVGGSDPTAFAGPHEEIYGLADLPPLAWGSIADAVAYAIELYFFALESVVATIVPQTGNPFAGMIATVVSVLVTVVVLEVTRRTVVALLIGVTDLDPTGVTTALISFLGIGAE